MHTHAQCDPGPCLVLSNCLKCAQLFVMDSGSEITSSGESGSDACTSKRERGKQSEDMCEFSHFSSHADLSYRILPWTIFSSHTAESKKVGKSLSRKKKRSKTETKDEHLDDQYMVSKPAFSIYTACGVLKIINIMINYNKYYQWEMTNLKWEKHVRKGEMSNK